METYLKVCPLLLEDWDAFQAVPSLLLQPSGFVRPPRPRSAVGVALVATFERFSALLASPDLRLGRIVIDEVHLLADESRGPTVETLLVRLKTWERPTSICALSAVISNPQDLADWLGVPLVLGSAEDRTVQVEFRREVAKDPAKRLESELEQVLAKGEQAIIFCHSKAASQKVAADLKPLVSRYLIDDDTSALREAATRAATLSEAGCPTPSTHSCVSCSP